jgi:hypothetical protein
MRPSDVREFVRRLEAIYQEFSSSSSIGEKMYGFVAGVYLPDQSELLKAVEKEARG